MSNVAILMAAGKGLRTGGDIPKQFVPVNGKMLMEYALTTFQQHPRIDEIVVVLPADCPDGIRQHLVATYPKITRLVEGGAERFQSSWNATRLFAQRPDDILLLHDAARPGLTVRIVDDLLDALATNQAAVTALPATDTVLRGSADGSLVETLDRAGLYYAQTPQAFRARLLVACFENLWADGDFAPTDESGLVTRYAPEVPVRLVPGDPKNFKVTYADDFDNLMDRI